MARIEFNLEGEITETNANVMQTMGYSERVVGAAPQNLL
jgi:hypothetical protein